MFGDTRRHEEFTQFAATAQQRLYRQGYLLTGSREASQDLVQATLTKMYVAWPRIENPSAYAYRTMLRGFLEIRRRSGRERELHDLPDGAPPRSDPAHALTVRAALAELPPRMRAVVVLRYWEDLSVEQTATALGCTTGTVKSTASRGLAQLRELLGEAFDERAPSPLTGTSTQKEKP
jgi:RNA polymerase sigma-70 factor (sigma-E family)